MKSKKIILISLCLIPLLMTGCGKVPKLENGKELVVEMKDASITVDDLYEEMKDRFARDILVDMIDKTILDKEYKTDEELDAQIKGQIDYIKEQTGDQYLQTIKAQWGLNNEEELYDFIEISLKRNKAVEDYAKSLITEDEINDYYEDETVGDIKARHILIKPDITDDMTDDEKDEKEKEALEKAKDLIKELNDGADFSELAKKNSDDEGSATNGGDLGWFNKGIMDDAFEKAAFDLDKGKYTKEPVKSSFGYHIIIKDDEKEKPKLEDVKDNIIETLGKEKINNEANINYIALEELRKKYELEIHDSTLKKQYNDYMNELKNQ